MTTTAVMSQGVRARVTVAGITFSAVEPGEAGNDLVITIEDDSGDWVIYGGGGDDEIALADGAEELVYLITDDGIDLSAIDGSDTVTGFDAGADRLTFVDSNGAAPTLAALLSRMDSVTLNYDATNNEYDSISFNMGETTLTIGLAIMALRAPCLIPPLKAGKRLQQQGQPQQGRQRSARQGLTISMICSAMAALLSAIPCPRNCFRPNCFSGAGGRCGSDCMSVQILINQLPQQHTLITYYECTSALRQCCLA